MQNAICSVESSLDSLRSNDIGAGSLEDTVEVVCEHGSTGHRPLERRRIWQLV